MNKQDITYTLGMYEQHIKQLSNQLRAVEENIIELNSLIFDLDEIKKGKEVLAQIGKGIFVNANLISEELTVNVGEKNFVKKNVPETKKLIKEQLGKLENVKKELEKRIDQLGREIQEVIAKVQEGKN